MGAHETCVLIDAAGRLVALSLLADGHVSSDGLKALGDAQFTERLGLAPGEFATIVQGLCEDLMLVAHLNWGEFDLLRAFANAWEVPPGPDVTCRQCAGPVVDNAR